MTKTMDAEAAEVVVMVVVGGDGDDGGGGGGEGRGRDILSSSHGNLPVLQSSVLLGLYFMDE
jgi:hypothetical protein